MPERLSRRRATSVKPSSPQGEDGGEGAWSLAVAILSEAEGSFTFLSTERGTLDAGVKRWSKDAIGGRITTEPSLGHDSGVEQAITELATGRDHRATDLAREEFDILESAAATFSKEGSGANLDDFGVLGVLSQSSIAAVKNVVSHALAAAC